MYVRPNQQELFKKWKYAVTGVFMDVPSNINSLNDSQKQTMEFVDDFMSSIIDVNKEGKYPDQINLQGLMGRVNR